MDAVLIQGESFRMTWTPWTKAATQTASDKTTQINGFFLALSAQEAEASSAGSSPSRVSITHTEHPSFHAAGLMS